MMNRKINRMFSFIMGMILLVFGVIGIAFCAVSIGITISNESFMKKAETVEAQIVSIHSTKNGHRVTVAYSIDGVKYEESIGFYSSNMQKGQTLTVAVDPENPTDVRYQTGFLPLIFGIIGGIFVLVSAIIIFVILSGRARKKRLLRDGRVVHAQVDRVFLNTHISMNTRNPYQICCHYVDVETGARHEFKSGYLWFDPSPYLTDATIPVYVAPNNFSRHYVDTHTIEERHNSPNLS